MRVSVFNCMNRFNRFMEPNVDLDLAPEEFQDLMDPMRGRAEPAFGL